MITEREAAIISAYTGFLVGRFCEMHKYIEQLLKRPVFTHELANKNIMDEIHRRSKKDFCDLAIVDVTPAEDRYGKDVKPEPKPLAQYLAKRLECGAKYVADHNSLCKLLEQALDVYESTENVRIKIEKQ